jgi:hypothetical protein
VLRFVVLAALCMSSNPVAAQNAAGETAAPINAKKAVRLPPGGPTPRTADGHPDLSGVWFAGQAGKQTFDAGARRQFDPKVTPEEPPPYQPWAAAKVKAMTRRFGWAAHPQLPPRGVPGMVLINRIPSSWSRPPGNWCSSPS